MRSKTEKGDLQVKDIYYRGKVIDIEKEFDTHIEKGISDRVAKRRQTKYGKNLIIASEQTKWYWILLDQFRDFMVLILLGATLLSGLLGEYTDAITIIAIVFLNAILGFYQEFKAEKSLEELKKITAPGTKVVRSGELKEIPAEDLVPGDLVYLETGDRIPADIRLVQVTGFECNEASLTGESDAVAKKSEEITGNIDSPGDLYNLALMGTLVVNGRGKGIVLQTGMDAEMGKIADLMQKENIKVETPLQKRLAQLGKILVGTCLIICALVIIMGIWRGESTYNMFMAGISLAVAAIPEGLPAIVTIALAIGVQRMMDRKALVRKLPAVETLGCATVICSDKTGTLTKNEIKLAESYFPAGENKNVANKALEIGVICNNSKLINKKGKNIELIGDPTEKALMEAGINEGLIKERIIQDYEFIVENSFDSEEKMMSVLYYEQNGEKYELFVKGAPEALIEKCDRVLTGVGEKQLNKYKKDEILKHNELMASKAYRNIAVAYRYLSEDEKFSSRSEQEQKLVFVGLFGLFDPPREESVQAVSSCKKAGIRPIMITGDHRTTALTIARKINLLPSWGEVMEGKELETLPMEDLKKRLKNTYVFARVAPHHKLRIVKALQELGHVVAMTGDGINDAPAVKASDIGISMGKTGTDVTKNAADLILSDDNFATIQAAIEEGRGIFDNIKKFIKFLLACNIGEILVMFWSMLFALPLPLKPIQILWVNLVTDGFPAIALGLDSKDNYVMNRPPRDPKEGIFTKDFSTVILRRGFLISVVTLFVFYRSLEINPDIHFARTMALSTLVVCQLLYVFECQSAKTIVSLERIIKNPAVIVAIIISFLMLLLVIYQPFFANVFDTFVISGREWAIVFIFSLIPGLVEWLYNMLMFKEK